MKLRQRIQPRKPKDRLRVRARRLRQRAGMIPARITAAVIKGRVVRANKKNAREERKEMEAAKSTGLDQHMIDALRKRK